MENHFTKWRWYKIFVESDGTTVTLSEKKDNFDASIVNNKLILPKDFKVTDYFNELHCIEAAEARKGYRSIQYTFSKNSINDTDGLTKVELPTKNFDHGYIYIRGFFS